MYTKGRKHSCWHIAYITLQNDVTNMSVYTCLILEFFKIKTNNNKPTLQCKILWIKPE